MKFLIFTLATLAVASAALPARFEDRNFWEGLLGAVLTPIGTALQTSAELLAQLTAGIAIGGIDAVTALFGKRSVDQRDWLDTLLQLGGNYITSVLQPAVTDAAQAAALMLAQITAGISEGGLNALLGLLGKRSVDTRVWDMITDIVGNYFGTVISPALTSAAQSLSLMAAQLLAGVAEGGLPALVNLLG